MKFVVNQKIIPALFLLAFAVLSFGCKGSGSPNGSVNVNGTPTDAYKKLFEAVKSKDTNRIKASMSKSTLGFADAHSKRTNQPIEKVLENGFMATTLAPSLPEIRDERVKDNMGAVEVYNIKESKWEDVPFIAEDGEWKLAVGDLFANTYKLPGKGRATLEMEAANANNMIIVNTNQMGNFTSAPRLPRTEDMTTNSNKSVGVPQSNKAK
ncbi:MAG: hypothetical protein LUM44_22960 [Pyrinomonadaceae bacterium]|nr:hypothetical protein [Pyrinomonadaceae bacterium]